MNPLMLVCMLKLIAFRRRAKNTLTAIGATGYDLAFWIGGVHIWRFSCVRFYHSRLRGSEPIEMRSWKRRMNSKAASRLVVVTTPNLALMALGIALWLL